MTHHDAWTVQASIERTNGEADATALTTALGAAAFLEDTVEITDETLFRTTERIPRVSDPRPSEPAPPTPQATPPLSDSPLHSRRTRRITVPVLLVALLLVTTLMAWRTIAPQSYADGIAQNRAQPTAVPAPFSGQPPSTLVAPDDGFVPEAIRPAPLPVRTVHQTVVMVVPLMGATTQSTKASQPPPQDEEESANSDESPETRAHNRSARASSSTTTPDPSASRTASESPFRLDA